MLTAKQAAELLGVSLSLVYTLAREGRIRHLRVGRRGCRGRLLFQERDLTAFLEQCSKEPPEEPDEAAYWRHRR